MQNRFFFFDIRIIINQNIFIIMKKLLAVTALFLAFGFNAQNVEAREQQVDCVQLAMDVHDAWTSQGFTHHYASGHADAAYNSCMGHR